MRTKKNIKLNNRTKKCRPSQKELKVYCREHANTFNRFEEQYELNFKDNLKKHFKDTERELVKLFNG